MAEVIHEFDLEVNTFENQYQVDVYDADQEWVGQTVGPDVGQVFRHALYLVDPVIAAATFPDYFDWAQTHKEPKDEIYE